MKNKGRRADYVPAGGSVKNRETTRDERLQIVALREKARMTWKEIGERMGLDFKTCQKIFSRTMAQGSPSNRRRSGQPVIFNEEEKERLRAFIIQDKRTRRMQWEEIIQELGYNCSARTVREVMASMGYHKQLPRGESEATISLEEWLGVRND
ncbi:hypothetical protein HOY82DRAFT_618728 [Tuber indicum]|nr:hypothetical protein HOY82DRAFT_618728 [Tuber indicum]